VFKLVTEARNIQQSYPGGVDWLVAAAKSFGSVLLECGLLAPSEKEMFLQSVEQMKADMRANRVDLANLTIGDLGVYATPEAALKLITLHQAKGREYDAVAMVDLHEGKIPFWQAKTEEEVLESKRQFYVGVTRARRFLMYITDSSNYRNTPTRFLRSGTGVGVC
jgi:DNA helicase-2/ATP-dependent DNA helicase PcrA